ncbi:MAG TPA: cob(I)yrinic acid a,c-diamide adenosyltransferase [Thermoanaerobaculaceae bacterium]|nr:cob(I)yrinic acid a,c-diamide adenosyltransferase [Thermoanaerobaculaceae bacterium]
MKVYTRVGDDGTTGLRDGSRISKAAPRVAAYGDVDELNAVIGVLRTEELPAPAGTRLEQVQATLFEVGAFLADRQARFRLSDAATQPDWLERWIDEMDTELEPLRNFVLPGGTRAAAIAHQARTVCRRAERGVVALADVGEAVAATVPFLNRLSDTLFVLARWLNRRAGTPDVRWQAGS